MYLLVESSKPTSPTFLESDHPGQITIHGVVFTEVPTNADGCLFLGFFDWLRSSDGEVVGVDLTFHDNRENAQSTLSNGNLGNRIAPDVVRVLFRSDVDIDPTISADQEFSVSRCYSAPDGRAALLFDASEVNPGP